MHFDNSRFDGEETFNNSNIAIGVGLRHPHYAEVLAKPAPIDFIEVHSENFFAQGGANRAFIQQVAAQYPVSLHSTALGLGSQTDIAQQYLSSFKRLIDDVKPFLMSDHAAFAWGMVNGKKVHAGDLLPIAFNQKNLRNMATNIDRIQQLSGKKILVENLSAYLIPNGSTMSETEFLVSLTEITGCELLIDLNNILVNAHNFSRLPAMEYTTKWLKEIPENVVGEIHLAGFSDVPLGDLAIDDHSQAISDDGWAIYKSALQRFGAQPTLIEWDNNLPSWQTLISEAQKARVIAEQVFQSSDTLMNFHELKPQPNNLDNVQWAQGVQ